MAQTCTTAYRKAREDCDAQFKALRDVVAKDDWARTVEVNSGGETPIPELTEDLADEVFGRMCRDA